MRYRRQGYELNVIWTEGDFQGTIAAFHRIHQQNYGFCDEKRAIEIVNVRLRMTAAGARYEPPRRDLVAGDGSAACYAEREVFFGARWLPTRVYRRDGLVPGDVVCGPAMIAEYTSATILHPGDQAEVDATGNLILTIAQEVRA
jgi:N-methylhydantoinase A